MLIPQDSGTFGVVGPHGLYLQPSLGVSGDKNHPCFEPPDWKPLIYPLPQLGVYLLPMSWDGLHAQRVCWGLCEDQADVAAARLLGGAE